MLRFHSLRSHPGSRRSGPFIQLVSFIPFALLTSFHFTSLHSTPSAPLVAGFDFIVFFIIPPPTSWKYERKRSDWSRRRKEQSDASLGTERGSGMKHMSVTEMKWRFNECAKWNDIATFNYLWSSPYSSPSLPPPPSLPVSLSAPARVSSVVRV